MIEHIQARLDRLRLFHAMEEDSIQSQIQSAIITEYEALLDHLTKPQSAIDRLAL
jgi:hypothetical protein